MSGLTYNLARPCLHSCRLTHCRRQMCTRATEDITTLISTTYLARKMIQHLDVPLISYWIIVLAEIMPRTALQGLEVQPNGLVSGITTFGLNGCRHDSSRTTTIVGVSETSAVSYVTLRQDTVMPCTCGPVIIDIQLTSSLVIDVTATLAQDRLSTSEFILSSLSHLCCFIFIIIVLTSILWRIFPRNQHCIFLRGSANLGVTAWSVKLKSKVVNKIVNCYYIDDIIIDIVGQIVRPSVLWHCWLGVRKSIRPVKIGWWGVGVVICLEWDADCLHYRPADVIAFQNPVISCLI